MLIILVLGFFIDFVEIAFIVVPILSPVAEALGINMVWFAILIAMNLQTCFLTPPFGFSLFYLKGVAPPESAPSISIGASCRSFACRSWCSPPSCCSRPGTGSAEKEIRIKKATMEGR